MKKKQKIKANPIVSGRFAGQPHLAGYLSCGFARLLFKLDNKVVKEALHKIRYHFAKPFAR